MVEQPGRSARCSGRGRGARWRGAARPDRDGRGGRRSDGASERHLLVQAGTGTGKSLGYLVPALLHQRPRRGGHGDAGAAAPARRARHPGPARGGRRPARRGGGTYAVLKGRSNYACLHRVREGVPDDQGALVELPEGSLGAEVVALREWVEEEASDGRHRRARPRAAAHRPRLAPGQRQPPRVPRRDQVPLRRRVLRRAGQGARLRARSWSSPTTRCSRSTRSRASR